MGKLRMRANLISTSLQRGANDPTDEATTVSTVSPGKPLKRLKPFPVIFLVTSLKRGANEMMNPGTAHL